MFCEGHPLKHIETWQNSLRQEVINYWPEITVTEPNMLVTDIKLPINSSEEYLRNVKMIVEGFIRVNPIPATSYRINYIMTDVTVNPDKNFCEL